MRPLPARWRGNGAESPVTKGEKARKTGPPGLPPRKKSRQGKKIGSHHEFLTSLLLLPIRSMLSTLTRESASDVSIECIGVEETLAEKVLSFLRRTAEARAGRNRAEYDDRLVRHLYDVRAIARGRDDLQLPHDHFAAMVAGDAAQYRNQYPEFEQDPMGQMRVVMDALHSDHEAFERDYLQFVDELVFGESVPFAEARSVFIELAERLMSGLPPSPKSETALQRMADNAREIGLDY